MGNVYPVMNWYKFLKPPSNLAKIEQKELNGKKTSDKSKILTEKRRTRGKIDSPNIHKYMTAPGFLQEQQ